jgi:uncharacterized Zn finger protein (UPF0148 family)
MTEEKNVKLEPIVCEDCGASVPLPEKAETTCPYCSARIETPEDYLKWRKSQQDALKKEERLLEIHKELGQNPSVIERAVVAVTGFAGGCLGCCLLPFIALFLWLYVTAGIMYLLGAISQMFPGLVVGEGVIHYLINAVIMLPAAFIVSFLGISLAVLKRKVNTKMALQGALVAGEPAHPGGPSTCRSCGAPLSVKPGKLCVPCYYCSTQNLVSLESDWVKQVKESADKKVKSLTQAINYFEDQNLVFKARKYTYTAIATIMLVLGALITVKTYEPPVKEKGLEFLIKNNQMRSSYEASSNLFLDLPVNVIIKSEKLHDYGYFNPGSLKFYIPMKKNEELEAKCLKDDSEQVFAVEISKVEPAKDKEDRATLVEKAELGGGKDIEFTAPDESFYSLVINLPEENLPRNLKFKFTVKGRPKAKFKELDFSKIKIHDYALGRSFSGKDEHKKDEYGWNLGSGRWAKVGFDSDRKIKSVSGNKISFSKEKKFDYRARMGEFWSYYKPVKQTISYGSKHKQRAVMFNYKKDEVNLEIKLQYGSLQAAKLFVKNSESENNKN